MLKQKDRYKWDSNLSKEFIYLFIHIVIKSINQLQTQAFNTENIKAVGQCDSTPSFKILQWIPGVLRMKTKFLVTWPRSKIRNLLPSLDPSWYFSLLLTHLQSHWPSLFHDLFIFSCHRAFAQAVSSTQNVPSILFAYLSHLLFSL